MEIKQHHLGLLPHLKPKSLNESAMFTIQILKKTIQYISNKQNEPTPVEMASKMLPKQRIRRSPNRPPQQQYSLDYGIPLCSQFEQTYEGIKNQNGRSQVLVNNDINKMRKKSPNIPTNSLQLFQQHQNRFPSIDHLDRFQNLKNRTLSLRYANRRTRSVSRQK